LGAQPQRLLWDIASIESDHTQAQVYIESLVGAGTVLAVSPSILQTQEQYSLTQARLMVDIDAAHQTLENLEQIIPLEAIAEHILSEELQRSQEAYQHLLRTIEQKQSF